MYKSYVIMTYKDLIFNTIEKHSYPFPLEQLQEYNVFNDKKAAYKLFENELSGMVENEFELISWELVGY